MSYPVRRAERVSEPAVEPVSVGESKTFLRIDGTTEDALLADLAQAARIVAEQETGLSLITQSWKLVFNDGVAQRVPLPHGPIQSITSVTIFSEAGEETLIDSDSYHLDASNQTLVFETIPYGHRIEIIYVAGFGDAADDVPADIVQGVLLHTAWLYEHRDSMMPPIASMLIYSHYRKIRL